MPVLRSLQQKLRGRKADSHSSQANHQYVRTQWTDSSLAADTIDSEDVRQSPNGPTRIVDNMNVQELDSEMSQTDESIYYMRSGRLRPLSPPPPTPSRLQPAPPVGDNTTPHRKYNNTPLHPKQYNPPFTGDSDSDGEGWRVSAARSHMRSASLRNLSPTHLRDRHYLQTRLTTPQQALVDTLQQAQVDLRALELENDTIMDGLRMVRRRANMLQGELALCRIRNEQTQASMDGLRDEINRQRAELDEERRKVEVDLERVRRERRRQT
ncbi:hypothetical protein DV735_g4464, partial [Chaetothyriales sp. CBS 134920]